MHPMDFDRSFIRQRTEDLRREVAMHRIATRGREGRRGPGRRVSPGATELFFALALGLVALTLGLAARPVPAAPVYEARELGPPVAEDSGYAADVNDAGRVVGRSTDTGGNNERALLWEDGQARDLGAVPGFANGEATAINDRGQIVGNSLDAHFTLRSRAFLWEGGQIRELGALSGHTESRAEDANGMGQVVGMSYGTFSNARATLWEDGRARGLAPLPGQTGSHARAVNDAGQAVGEAIAFGRRQAVLWEGDQVRSLAPFPGKPDSVALDISGDGRAVGYATDGQAGDLAVFWEGGQVRELGALPGRSTSLAFGTNDSGQGVGRSGFSAVLWEDGAVRDLNGLIPEDSGWHLVSALAVNDQGQIVGVGQKNGRHRAFLLTPASPPETKVTSGPERFTRSTSAAFAFSSTETDSSFEGSLDGAPFGACSSPGTYSGLGSSGHSFEVRATDAAGNADPTPATRTWIVDRTRPSVSGVSPKKGAKAGDASPAVRALAKDSQSNLRKGNVRIYVDGKARGLSYSTSTDRLVHRSKKLEPGRHTVRVVARDAAGNAASKTWRFTVKRR